MSKSFTPDHREPSTHNHGGMPNLLAEQPPRDVPESILHYQIVEELGRDGMGAVYPKKREIV